MSKEQGESTPGDAGLQSEALSNEVLKLKIDDLFQEVESLKSRVARLESESKDKSITTAETPDPNRTVVSDLDKPGGT